MAVKYGHGEKATTYLTVAERNLAAHAKHGDALTVDTDYLGLIEEGGKKEYGFKCTLTVQDSDRGITLRTVTGWGRKLITIDNAFAKAETQAFGRALQHLGFVGDADIANAFDEEDLEGGHPITEEEDKKAATEEEDKTGSSNGSTPTPKGKLLPKGELLEQIREALGALGSDGNLAINAAQYLYPAANIETKEQVKALQPKYLTAILENLRNRIPVVEEQEVDGE